MQQHADIVTDLKGNVVRAAQVRVLLLDGTLATIYAANGGAPTGNPLTSGQKGEFAFYAPNGDYTLEISVEGRVFGTLGPVKLYDALEDTDRVTKAELAAGSGTTLITFTQAGVGAVPRQVESKLREIVSVFDFMTPELIADVRSGAPVLDHTVALQKAIDAVRGKLFLPYGTYMLSATLRLKPETILIGDGAGAYFQGPGYPRVSVLKPVAGFSDADVLRADPADVSAGLSYTYGVALRDLLIDAINIKNSSKTLINLLSLSNTETFDSVRIINYNNNIALHIGKSTNASSFESDGLVFTNLYCLPCDTSGPSTVPVVKITACNEVTIRDSKIQGGAGTLAGSSAVLISAANGRGINGVTLDSVALTGAETGLLVQGNASDGQGPRHVRVLNCTTEGVKYGVRAVGDVTRPVQFLTIGPGNRFTAMVAGGSAVVLDAYASNSQIYADEQSDILLLSNSNGNIVYGGGTVTDSGSNNARIFRNANKIDTNGFYIEPWVAPTISSGWVANTVSRNSEGCRKNSFGQAFTKGYLTDGLWGYPNFFATFPVGHRPPKPVELVAACGSGTCRVTILDTGEAFATGGSGFLSLDGLSFWTI